MRDRFPDRKAILVGGLFAQGGRVLNQFINVAVPEKLAHIQHEEWSLAARSQRRNGSLR